MGKIVKGVKMYDTTKEHSAIYGLDAKKPLYIQTIKYSTTIMKQVVDYAIKNNNDVIFGHIEEKSSVSIDVIKFILINSGFKTCEGNNDFYKILI